MYLSYFAYGSNLFAPRLVQRVPSTRVHKTAVLPGYELRFHKGGADGSAKANAFFTNEKHHQVHGMLYHMVEAEKHLLDACEGGYDCRDVEVLTDAGIVHAFTYIAQPHLLDESLAPFHWYKAYVQQGAEQHGLLQDYVAGISEHHSVEDPNRQREAEHFEMLGIIDPSNAIG
jgi:hypothetical protein